MNQINKFRCMIQNLQNFKKIGQFIDKTQGQLTIIKNKFDELLYQKIINFLQNRYKQPPQDFYLENITKGQCIFNFLAQRLTSIGRSNDQIIRKIKQMQQSEESKINKPNIMEMNRFLSKEKTNNFSFSQECKFPIFPSVPLVLDKNLIQMNLQNNLIESYQNSSAGLPESKIDTKYNLLASIQNNLHPFARINQHFQKSNFKKSCESIIVNQHLQDYTNIYDYQDYNLNDAKFRNNKSNKKNNILDEYQLFSDYKEKKQNNIKKVYHYRTQDQIKNITNKDILSNQLFTLNPCFADQNYMKEDKIQEIKNKPNFNRKTNKKTNSEYKSKLKGKKKQQRFICLDNRIDINRQFIENQ